MGFPSRLTALAVFPAFLPCLALSQQPRLGTKVTLPSGTALAVTTPKAVPMRAGAELSTRLLYPVYCNNRLVLPAGTAVTGSIVSLLPNHAARLDARLGGDFTPMHKAVVQFTTILLPSGVVLPITTGTVTDGAPIYKVVAPPPGQGGFIHRQYEQLRQRAHDTLAIATGPDKLDRARQFVYGQLPYHPERIAKNTSWTVETDAPLTFPQPASAAPSPVAVVPVPPADPQVWLVNAYLAHAMSSANAKPGQEIQATVAEPILAADGTIAVPQGSVLSGTITQARRARTFGRSARLRFRFTKLTLPGGSAQSVRTSLKQVDSNTPDGLQMTQEGEVKPKPHSKVVVPLLLAALAAQPFDQEHGHDQLRKAGEASNSLGILGFIIGVAAQQPNLAAGIGFYGAALSLYQRLIRRGPEVAFVRDTRIVLQTTPTSNSPLKAATH